MQVGNKKQQTARDDEILGLNSPWQALLRPRPSCGGTSAGHNSPPCVYVALLLLLEPTRKKKKKNVEEKIREANDTRKLYNRPFSPTACVLSTLSFRRKRRRWVGATKERGRDRGLGTGRLICAYTVAKINQYTGL